MFYQSIFKTLLCQEFAGEDSDMFMFGNLYFVYLHEEVMPLIV